MIELKNKFDCCGCTACESICSKKAIKMQSDEEGFMYPDINISLCVNCHLCEKVCPIINNHLNNYNIIKIFAVKNKDINVLHKSSSGGVFPEIANLFYNQKGNIYGVVYDNKYNVIHKKAISNNEITKFYGSKYVQSNIIGIYKEIKNLLKAGETVLFSGTPCQVEGLKLFLIKPYDNLYTIDILCHGVASPKIFSEYINFINRKTLGNLENIFMKDKTFGWGYQNTKLYFKGGRTEFNSPISNLWNNIYYDHICNRPSCHQCKFTNFHRVGDISLGDFWGIEKSHKNFFSNLGVSLVMINTKKGEFIWENIKNRFEYLESNINECMQPVLCSPHPESKDRKLFWYDYATKGFDKVIRERYNLTNKILFKNYILQIKNLILKKLSWHQ